jgi:hypothetical protein
MSVQAFMTNGGAIVDVKRNLVKAYKSIKTIMNDNNYFIYHLS